MRHLTVESHDDLLKAIEDNKGSYTKIFLLFTGSKDEQGISWCPPCNAAEPVLKKALEEFEAEEPEDASQTLFVKIMVGGMDVWKDLENPSPFRKAFTLKWVPTLLKYGTVS